MSQQALYADSAIGWAAEKGITVGCRPATEAASAKFCPTDKVSRGQIATFLYRHVGATHEVADSGFGDVAADAYYALPVAWMVLHEITTGCSADAFCPQYPATRAHAAAFIYRVATQPESWGSQGILEQQTPPSRTSEASGQPLSGMFASFLCDRQLPSADQTLLIKPPVAKCRGEADILLKFKSSLARIRHPGNYIFCRSALNP